ncbi:uncharacterized protein LOC131326672 [Rhododendron vialii]|uniref:uncharacterized protein LOC131326672 n=1 Tax=Rhododendron vialii TaxID=182163 RepID=UPI00265F6FF9|nr:uncharacterized protein LOC131326672 [Rhododendron vialii]
MVEQNHALLAKWWWRISRENDSLWARVVCRKYGLSHQDWLPQLPSYGRASIIWRDICSIGNTENAMGNVIQDGFRIQVYSGNNTSFWNHKWMGDQTLRQEFPRLYLKSSQRDELVCNVLNSVGNGDWSLFFQRRLHDWEREQMNDLIGRLQYVSLVPSRLDVMLWIGNSNNLFSVKSVYDLWEAETFTQNFGLGSLWRSLSPPKVEIFSWMACQSKIATRSILSSRNIMVGVDETALFCPFCLLELETPVHVLLSCPFSTVIWSRIADWWNIVWVAPSNLADLSFWWFSSHFKNLEKHLWECCFYATLWSIWIARNDAIFNNKIVDCNHLEELIKSRAAMWIKAKFDIKVYTVEDIKSNLDGVRRLVI